MRMQRQCRPPPVTVNVAVFVIPPCDAVIVTLVEFDTRLVLIVNVALFEPAATVTVDGTDATDELLEERFTVVFADALAVNVTVPCESFPPETLVGLNVSEDKVTLPAMDEDVVGARRAAPAGAAVERAAAAVGDRATVLALSRARRRRARRPAHIRRPATAACLGRAADAAIEGAAAAVGDTAA